MEKQTDGWKTGNQRSWKLFIRIMCPDFLKALQIANNLSAKLQTDITFRKICILSVKFVLRNIKHIQDCRISLTVYVESYQSDPRGSSGQKNLSWDHVTITL